MHVSKGGARKATTRNHGKSMAGNMILWEMEIKNVYREIEGK